MDLSWQGIAVDRSVSPKDPKLSGIGSKALNLLVYSPDDLAVFEVPSRSSEQRAGGPGEAVRVR